MSRAPTGAARERMLDGARRGRATVLAQRRADKVAGMAAAVEFRERRRCRAEVPDPASLTGVRECRALGWQPCAHRPNGASRPVAVPSTQPEAAR